MKEQEKKQHKKRKGKTTKNYIGKRNLLISIAAFIVIVYLLYTIYLLIKQPTNVFTIEEGKLYKEETDIGYVIRNEKVAKGENYRNGMEQIKAEGERAAVNENIFRYYSKNEENLKKKISELDLKIQEVMKSDKTLQTADMRNLENQIESKLEDVSKLKDVSKLIEYKKEIDNLVAKKAKIAGDGSPQGSYLRDLIEERKSYENQLNSGAEYVKSPMSGLVSYRVDGLEEILTPENFEMINEEYLEKLDLKTGKIVATNEECGKVIDNFSCYIVLITDSEESKSSKVGDNVKVRLPSNVEIKAEIVNISSENDEKRILFLKINNQVEELINYRKITFDLIWWDSSGLKVPNQAIIKIDNLDYVIRGRAGYLSKILIKVKKQTEKYSIVEPYTNEELKELGFSDKEVNNYKKISIYDEIIVNPDISKVD